MKLLKIKGLLMIVMLFSTTVVTVGAGHENPPPSISLALGSGGAGGLTHIAMLQASAHCASNPDNDKIKSPPLAMTNDRMSRFGQYCVGD